MNPVSIADLLIASPRGFKYVSRNSHLGQQFDSVGSGNASERWVLINGQWITHVLLVATFDTAA